MIDLDAIWTDKDELYCQFGVALCLRRIDYTAWRKLCMFCGVHDYVLPNNRCCSSRFTDVMYVRVQPTAEFMWLTMTVKHLEAHYTEQQQIRIAQILEEASDSRMEKRPDFHGIIDAQEFEYDHGN